MPFIIPVQRVKSKDNVTERVQLLQSPNEGKMHNVAQSKHLPKLDRISILAATILLIYILARFINFPALEYFIPFPGAYLSFDLDINTIVAIFVIGLTSSGVDWLLREHPALEGRLTIQHWLLPTLTAWAIGVALIQQPLDALWWIGFALGSSILILVVIAEYVTVDPADIRRLPASMALTAVAFALFFILVVMVRARGMRLFLIVPTITFVAGLVSLRVLHLQMGGSWAFIPTAVIMLITGQITAAIYYLPISPSAFALSLVGLAYALTNLAAGILGEKTWQQLIFEPILVLVITWGIALFLL